nr:unnamed protein product [Spirometra erinaceieuropaei]
MGLDLTEKLTTDIVARKHHNICALNKFVYGRRRDLIILDTTYRLFPLLDMDSFDSLSSDQYLELLENKLRFWSQG